MVERDLKRIEETIRKQEEIVNQLTGVCRPLLVAEAEQLLDRFRRLRDADIERRNRLTLELERLEVRP